MQPCKLICKNPGDEPLQIWHKGETGSGLGGLGGGGGRKIYETLHNIVLVCLERNPNMFVGRCWIAGIGRQYIKNDEYVYKYTSAVLAA